MSATVSKWLKSIDGLHEVATRLRRVQIENRPALEVIRGYDDKKTLFYVDPPYLHSARKDGSAYGEFEMNEDEHRELADALNSCRGRVAISGYPHPLYEELFRPRKWRKIVGNPKRLRISKSVGTRTEVLWTNYRP
jgi:DNA adenine methylase